MTKIDIKRYKHKEKSIPPKTVRYCYICKKKTKWMFNPRIGHSLCGECGYRKISDILINYEGRIMEKETKTKEEKHKTKNTYVQSYLQKLLDKKVKCVLLNSEIMEGTLIGINQYEIVMLVSNIAGEVITNEQVVIFKHGILTIKECKHDQC